MAANPKHRRKFSNLLLALLCLLIVALVSGLSATAVWAGVQADGTLLVQKAVLDGEGDPVNPNQTFELAILNENGIGIGSAAVEANASPVGLSLTPGNYGVREDNLAQGWTLDNISCTSRDGNSSFGDFTPGDTTLDVMLGEGDQVLCTFTNSFSDAANITIIKDVTGGFSSEDFSFNFYGYNPFELLQQFSLDDDGDNSNSLSNTFVIELPPNRQYGFSEAGKEGWNLPDIQCSSSDTNRVFPGLSADPNNNGLGISVSNVQAFEEITCTFINPRPELVHKDGFESLPP